MLSVFFFSGMFSITFHCILTNYSRGPPRFLQSSDIVIVQAKDKSIMAFSFHDCVYLRIWEQEMCRRLQAESKDDSIFVEQLISANKEKNTSLPASNKLNQINTLNIQTTNWLSDPRWLRLVWQWFSYTDFFLAKFLATVFSGDHQVGLIQNSFESKRWPWC